MRLLTSTRFAAAAALIATFIGPATAADKYPTRQVTIVTTLPAGSTVDGLARVFAQQLSTRLKDSVIVENKAGAGLMLGMQAVANAPADAHTLAFTPVTPLSIQTIRHKNAGYSLESFVPLCQTFENVFFLAVSPNSDIKDARALLDRLKKTPGKFAYGHSGSGSAPHLIRVPAEGGSVPAKRDVPGPQGLHRASGSGPRIQGEAGAEPEPQGIGP